MIVNLLFEIKGSYAQDMAGIVSDRYSGINRGIINPALLYHSPNCIDFSLVTAHIGGQNNYLYLPAGEFRAGDFIRFRSRILENYDNYFSERQQEEVYNGFLYGRLQGPSVRFRYKNHVFAFTNALRTLSSANRIPGHMVRFARRGLTYSPQHDIIYTEIRPFQIASMGWLEAGFSYANELAVHRTHNITAGASARLLLPYHAGSARSNELDYFVTPQRNVYINKFNLEAYEALPIDYDNIEYTGADQLIRGRGVSFDLGISYTRTSGNFRNRSGRRLRTDLSYESYVYQIGFSLLDLGFVNMTQNTRYYAFDEAMLVWENPDTENYYNLDDMLDDMEQGLLSGEIMRTQGDPFRMYLPSGASIQADYNLGNNFFAHFLWVQDLPLAKTRVSRPSYIGFVPRYETRWFSVSLPLTLHEYRLPRAGVAFRIGFLTIGAEQAGGILNINDMDGMDVYFSIQWGFEDCKLTRRKTNSCIHHWY
jgi:hypothetical protein